MALDPKGPLPPFIATMSIAMSAYRLTTAVDKMRGRPEVFWRSDQVPHVSPCFGPLLADLGENPEGSDGRSSAPSELEIVR